MRRCPFRCRQMEIVQKACNRKSLGPWKLIGGINKNRPNSTDITNVEKFLMNIIDSGKFELIIPSDGEYEIVVNAKHASGMLEIKKQ